MAYSVLSSRYSMIGLVVRIRAGFRVQHGAALGDGHYQATAE